MRFGDGVVRTHTRTTTRIQTIGRTHQRTVVKMAPRTDGVSQATVSRSDGVLAWSSDASWQRRTDGVPPPCGVSTTGVTKK